MAEPKGFQTLAEFYPHYLSEHSDPRCRALHYVGSTLVVALLVFAVMTDHYATLWFLPVIGYGFAWFGHFFLERNRPATFQYPVYSFLSDWIMLKDFLSGRFRNGFPGSANPGN